MEAIPFESLVKTYMEIGILGLLSIIFILIIIAVTKRLLKSWNNNDKALETKDSTIRELYEKMLQIQRDSIESMGKNIVKEIVEHTPSPEENKQLTKIQNQINKTLQDALNETEASRIVVVQYHNGGRGINKQSFLKMSATNERMLVGETPFVPAFQNQFRSVLSYIVGELEKHKKFDIENIEDLKELDYGSYDYLKTYDIKEAYYRALIGQQNMIIGFVVVLFTNNNPKKGNRKLINDVMKTKCETLESLLSLDVKED